jgi:hypothetical protein
VKMAALCEKPGRIFGAIARDQVWLIALTVSPGAVRRDGEIILLKAQLGHQLTCAARP